MARFQVILVNCNERLVMDVAAHSLGELERDIWTSKMLEGRLVTADGVATSRNVLVAVSRIAAVVEPDDECF